MAWYSGGNFIGLDGTQIPHMVAGIANAIAERFDAMGMTPPGMMTTASGEKASGFVAADFVDMDLFDCQTQLDALYDNMRALIQPALHPNVNAGEALRLLGWARDPMDTGETADAFWPSLSAIVDAHNAANGTAYTLSAEHALEANYWMGLRVCLDALVYPVYAIGRYTRRETGGADEVANPETMKNRSTDYYPFGGSLEVWTTSALEAYQSLGATETITGELRLGSIFRVVHQIRQLGWDNAGTISVFDDRPNYQCLQEPFHYAAPILLEGIQSGGTIKGSLLGARLVLELVANTCPEFSVSALGALFTYARGEDGYDSGGAFVTQAVSGVALNSATTCALEFSDDGHPFDGPSKLVGRTYGNPPSVFWYPLEKYGLCMAYLRTRWSRENRAGSVPTTAANNLSSISTWNVGDSEYHVIATGTSGEGSREDGPAVTPNPYQFSRAYIDIRGELTDQA